jgi:hypothetical protein
MFLISRQVLNPDLGNRGIVEPIDGVLGLARDTPPPKVPDYTPPRSLVKAMTENNMLGAFPAFSFYLTDPLQKDTYSWADTGERVWNYVKGHEKIDKDRADTDPDYDPEPKTYWMDMPDHTLWLFNCDGISFGDPFQPVGDSE